MTLNEMKAQYMGKKVRDKDGCEATVTAVRSLSKGKPGFQLELNGEVKIGWQKFTLRRFTVVS